MRRSTTEHAKNSDVLRADTTFGIAVALVSLVISAGVSSTIVSLVAMQ